MRHNSLVFLCLAIFLAVSNGATDYVISPSSRIASCQPVAKCFTLSQFAANSKAYNKQNTTLIFQPGNHTLDSELIISSINHFSMKSLLKGTVNMICTQTGKISLKSVKSAHIKDIFFTYCAGNTFSNVKYVQFTRLVFSGPSLSASGSALKLNNTNAFISHCSYSSYLYGSLHRINSQFQRSFSLRESVVWGGGAINAIGSNVTVYGCNFKGNRAQFGGAMYTTTSNVTIISSVFDFNTANSSQSSVAAGGSAIFAVNATVFVHNTTIVKNNVYYGNTKGGAISIIDSKLTLSQSLIKDNIAIDTGGAVHALFSNVIVLNSSCYENKANNGGTFAVNASNLTIRNSVILKSRVNTNGGAIFATQSIIVVQSSSVKDNFAGVGGAIFSTSSLIELRQSIFLQNIAVKDGGIIYCIDSCNIQAEESVFHSNSVEQRGGVVRVDNKCMVTIKLCRLTNNTASNGGFLSAGPSNIINVMRSIFQYNMAYSKGGVIATSSSSLDISNSSFINNRAFVGGVIAIESKSSLVSSSCLFKSNSADRGGAMNIVESIATFANVSIISNFAKRGVVLLVKSNVTLSNLTMFRSNKGSFLASNSSIRFFGYTLFKDNSASFSSTPHYGGAITLIHSNLLLGGPVFTFVNNSALDGGAIYANMSTITSTGKLLALRNVAQSSGGAMYLLNCELQCAGKIKFSGNIAVKQGGAIDTLNSSMALNSNCSLSFKNNFAAAGDDIIMDTN